MSFFTETSTLPSLTVQIADLSMSFDSVMFPENFFLTRPFFLRQSLGVFLSVELVRMSLNFLNEARMTLFKGHASSGPSYEDPVPRCLFPRRLLRPPPLSPPPTPIRLPWLLSQSLPAGVFPSRAGRPPPGFSL